MPPVPGAGLSFAPGPTSAASPSPPGSAPLASRHAKKSSAEETRLFRSLIALHCSVLFLPRGWSMRPSWRHDVRVPCPVDPSARLLSIEGFLQGSSLQWQGKPQTLRPSAMSRAFRCSSCSVSSANADNADRPRGRKKSPRLVQGRVRVEEADLSTLPADSSVWSGRVLQCSRHS